MAKLTASKKKAKPNKEFGLPEQRAGFRCERRGDQDFTILDTRSHDEPWGVVRKKYDPSPPVSRRGAGKGL